ncbi:MAG: GNAT family N-acetyltransferase [Syntrophomonas sp.]
MITWHPVSNETSPGEWDNNLLLYPDYNIYQAYAWGQHREDFGWKPLRLTARDEENNPVAMMQVMLRRYPGNVVLLWSPGGPVGNIEAWNENLHQELVRQAGSGNVFCRIASQRAYQTVDVLHLKAASWTKSSRPLNSGWTMMLELSDEDRFLSGLSKEWQLKLDRSQKLEKSITLWEKPELNAMLKVYDAMEDYEGLEDHSRDRLQSLFQRCGENILIFKCLGDNDEVIGFRACTFFGDKAWDLLGGATPEGRKANVSYGLTRAMLNHCMKMGVKHYDLSGIDPFGLKWVIDYKKGTGARPLEYLGEWEWSTSGWLKRGANWAIKKKGDGL